MSTILSRKLKDLRSLRNLSAEEVSKKLKRYVRDYTVQSIYKWEEGKARPKLEVILALSKIFHCDVSYLIEEKNLTYKNLTSSEIFLLHEYRDDFLFRSIATQVMRLLK